MDPKESPGTRLRHMLGAEDSDQKLSPAEENILLKSQLEQMHLKMSMFEDEGLDLLEFNREL